MRRFCIGLVLLCWASVARAGPCDSDLCVQPLLRGEAAPWDGQLLSHKQTASLLVASDGCFDRVALEVNRERERCEKEMKSQSEQFDEQLELLDRELYEDVWWRYPVPLWATGASFGVGALLVLIVAAAT